MSHKLIVTHTDGRVDHVEVDEFVFRVTSDPAANVHVGSVGFTSVKQIELEPAPARPPRPQTEPVEKAKPKAPAKRRKRLLGGK